MRIVFNFLERFAAVFFGHVQVQQNKAGCWVLVFVGKFAAVVQVVQQFFAVLYKLNVVVQAAFLQRFFYKHPVFGIIVGNKYNYRSSVGAHVSVFIPADVFLLR